MYQPKFQGKICFMNRHGDSYACNPKYITEEIISQKLSLELIWFMHDLSTPMPNNVRKVLLNSSEMYKELATSDIFIFNLTDYYYPKKLGQFWIMTWHGGQGFKLVQRLAENRLYKSYVENSKKIAANIDLILAGSEYQYQEIKYEWYYKGLILKSGLPRNDIFFKDNSKLIDKTRISLNIPDDYSLIIYAPTFRTGIKYNFEVYQFDVDKLLSSLYKRFNKKFKLLTRIHPLYSWRHITSSSIFKEHPDVIDVTHYSDVQPLLLASDILISDYSSIINEFLVMNKPVFIYAKDLYSYLQERGVNWTYWNIPYKINITENELFKSIEEYSEEETFIKRQQFIDSVKLYDNGEASKKVVEIIKSVLNI